MSEVVCPKGSPYGHSCCAEVERLRAKIESALEIAEHTWDLTDCRMMMVDALKGGKP